MAISGKGDAYDRITFDLRYPVSKTLRRIFELWCAPEEAEVLAELPAPPTEIARRLNRDIAAVEAQT